MTGTRYNVKTERMNQPKVLTRFNASRPASPTTVQEREKTQSGWGMVSGPKLQQHSLPVTVYSFGTYKQEVKTLKHLLVKDRTLRGSYISYYLAIAKLLNSYVT